MAKIHPEIDQDLERECERAKKWAMEILREKGNFGGTVLVIKPDCSMIVCAFFFKNDDEKQKLAFMIRMLAKKENAIAIIQVSDAYLSKSKAAAFEAGKYVRPSQDPNRVETLIVSAVGRNGFSRFHFVPYERKNGMIEFCEDKEINGGQDILFTNYLFGSVFEKKEGA